jgi:hypothetical protein
MRLLNLLVIDVLARLRIAFATLLVIVLKSPFLLIAQLLRRSPSFEKQRPDFIYQIQNQSGDDKKFKHGIYLVNNRKTKV